MKIWKRSMGLALSAALLAGALTGCTTGGNKGDSATPAPTASAAEDEAPLVSTEDVVKKLMGISGDTPMFTVDGEEVTAEQLFYWIGVAAENGGGLDTIDWTAQTDGKTKAEGLLAQLKAVTGEEQLKLFDQLMNENSEDGRNADGTLGAPDGYLFGTGEMVAEFEDGTLALEYGQISDLIKTDYGYHIILRLAPDNAEMREGWASLKMQELAETWMKDAKVVDLPEMSKVDVRSFCEKLTDYRASLEPAPTETPAPTATTVPSPSGNE